MTGPRNISRRLAGLALVSVAAVGLARADDWPTYRHDNRRSGVTGEQLRLPLRQVWAHEPLSPPQPAWTGPAKWDAYAGIKGLGSMRDFDSACHVTAAGGAVGFASSADDSVHCLDAASGKERWAFCTDGPVRAPPTWHDGRAYFGSDDGFVYCVRARDGTLVWKHRPAPAGRLIASNGKLISPWPCRTGVLVAGGKAFFAASLLPWRPSYLCAVDAATGADRGPGLYVAAHDGATMQGAMLASAERLYVLQGRSAPTVFNLADGKALGTVGGGGGCCALLTERSHLIHGPGNKAGWLSLSDDGRDQVLSMEGASHAVVVGPNVYVHQRATLSALRYDPYYELGVRIRDLSRRQAAMGKQLKALAAKKEADGRAAELKGELAKLAAETLRLRESASGCELWRVRSGRLGCLIAAGDVLLAGGEGDVRAFRARDGAEVWTAAVKGNALGLAVADGRLLVSTDSGAIHCFAAGGPDRP